MENNNQIRGDANASSQETIFTEDQFSMDGYDKHIRHARNAIYAAAVILAINLIIIAATIPDDYDYFWLYCLVWGGFIAGFVILALWTKKKPFNAIIGALILYGLLILLNAFIDITSVYKGIIFKVIIIVALFKGLSDARDAQQMQEQLKNKD
jgi:peptidoglycan/LPS O-acetylase OafA/YrhL